jgi:hypothetical protein
LGKKVETILRNIKAVFIASIKVTNHPMEKTASRIIGKLQ